MTEQQILKVFQNSKELSILTNADLICKDCKYKSGIISCILTGSYTKPKSVFYDKCVHYQKIYIEKT